MRPGALPAVLAVLAALAPDAAANGRPPATSGVYFRPGDARSILVRSTLGLLVSRDGGCSFRWICEQAIGYAGRFDPKYAVAAGGTIFATTFTGLRVSRDGGCTWRTATEDRPPGDPGRIAGMWVDAIDIGPDGDVWVATADSGRPNNVYRSTDGGETFAPRGLGSPAIWWKSVKVAPADPRRIYATGYQVAGPPLPDGRPQPPAAHFRRSDDAGARWTPSPLDGVAVGGTPIVHAIAVDPARPDVVFLRSLGASPPSGDRLYRSIDAGRTFREVLATSAAIHDVVLHGGAVLVATVSGAFRSGDGGATFERLPAAPQLACLGAHGDRLLGCGGNWQPDEKAVASSADGGASWDKVLRFAELAGPLACPAGTPAHELCGPRWPGLQQQLGAAGTTRCPAPPPDPAPPPAPPARTQGGGCCDAGDDRG
ncbi:MAG TPA: hypothetical protein VK932_17315, partial [Kofleriaceae bacterium]|nr:hypothetical protein [Kofleriaceae bacterium]